ncbi:MAG TPA: alternative ribosome rescue aminoacyl-tRNA hydrolase ArfB [Cyclobacteriaceae bacterium]
MRQSGRITANDLINEIKFTTARSSGPGGQHANKVETKVQLYFDVHNSEVLSDIQKAMIATKAGNKINKHGQLIISEESKRSQLNNKTLALKKLDRLLARAFTTKKKRKPTKPGKAAIQDRLNKKKQHSEKKKLRKRIV